MAFDEFRGRMQFHLANLPRNVPNIPNIPVRMTIASIADPTCGLATQHQDEAVRRVCSLPHRPRGVSLREFHPLSALEGPPLAIVEVGGYVDPSLATSPPPIAMRFLDSGESGNQFLAEILEAVPGEVGVV